MNLQSVEKYMALDLIISQHGGRVQHLVEQNRTVPDILKLHE